MRRSGFVVVAAFALASAVPTAHATPAPASEPEANTPLSIWSPDGGGGFTHRQSGLVCPANFRGYRLRVAHAFDGFGLDVGCDYQAGRSDITVYLTRREGFTAASAYKSAKDAILKTRASQHPKFVSDTHPSVGRPAWSVALYAEDEGWRDSVWMADFDGWALEYRVTYHDGDEAATQADMAALEAVVEASAGARLDVCAKSTPPERTGVAAASKDTAADALMSAIVGASAREPEPGKPVEAPKPVIWCAERSLPGGSFPMLLWRGVLDDGSDAAVDKVSVMTVGEPPGMNARDDALSELIDHEENKPANWVATVTRGQRTEVDGYFAGRPKPEALAALFSDVLNGKTRPLSSYDAASKRIEIAMPPKP